ncbi:MAG: hypothetical protein IPP01_00745 [Saprospiraceae bacterium]|nr:hypothetical protein [Saprospiraceae bacterium]
MNAELIYAIEFTISLGLFYILYYFVLRKETFFKWNRLFIIVAVLISIFMPFFKSYFIQHQLISPIKVLEEETLSFILPYTVVIEGNQSAVNWMLVGKLLILTISIIFYSKIYLWIIQNISNDSCW